MVWFFFLELDYKLKDKIVSYDSLQCLIHHVFSITNWILTADQQNTPPQTHKQFPVAVYYGFKLKICGENSLWVNHTIIKVTKVDWPLVWHYLKTKR